MSEIYKVVHKKGFFDKEVFVKAKNIKEALDKGIIALKKVYKQEECEELSTEEIIKWINRVSFECNLTNVNFKELRQNE